MASISEHAALAGEKKSNTEGAAAGETGGATGTEKIWSPSGSSWRDFLYFCGPGWFVSSKLWVEECRLSYLCLFTLLFGKES